jgi:hypothetical protein
MDITTEELDRLLARLADISADLVGLAQAITSLAAEMSAARTGTRSQEPATVRPAP